MWSSTLRLRLPMAKRRSFILKGVEAAAKLAQVRAPARERSALVRLSRTAAFSCSLSPRRALFAWGLRSTSLCPRPRRDGRCRGGQPTHPHTHSPRRCQALLQACHGAGRQAGALHAAGGVYGARRGRRAGGPRSAWVVRPAGACVHARVWGSRGAVGHRAARRCVRVCMLGGSGGGTGQRGGGVRDSYPHTPRSPLLQCATDPGTSAA